MMELVLYMEGDVFAMLRCKCGSCEYIPMSDLDSHTEKYCILKDGVTPICTECNTPHTDKVICKEAPTGKLNLPKCPTCNSTNIEKISTGKKLVGFAAVGVFSSNFGKSMKCKNCGYKW